MFGEEASSVQARPGDRLQTAHRRVNGPHPPHRPVILLNYTRIYLGIRVTASGDFRAQMLVLAPRGAPAKIEH